mmetsp:Transcript_31665/g.73960  ORF Transcript_31665/g.73960 Transcript_31665/m.73960 type:complete len:267 (+) Transcript_31665:82-882(+)
MALAVATSSGAWVNTPCTTSGKIQPLLSNTSLRAAESAPSTNGAHNALIGLSGLAASALVSRSAQRQRRQRRLRSALAADADGGRSITTAFEADLDFTIPSADTASMDAFMKENMIEVCLQNVERIEPTDDPQKNILYLEPQDFGPSRTQMRLTVNVDLIRSGCVEVDILEMEPGAVDKKTGEVTFDPANKPDFTAENFITWEEKAGRLYVKNISKSSSTMSLPWWFPLPDALVAKISEVFTRQVVTTGMKKVNEQIKKRYLEWSA